jgi:hypothetical protein
MDISLEDIEKELTASGWQPKPEDDLPVSEEELLAKIKETACAMDANVKRRVECTGTTPSQAVREVRKKKIMMPKGAMALLLLGLMGPWGDQQNSQPMIAPTGAT